jgi:hypothetical protein
MLLWMSAGGDTGAPIPVAVFAPADATDSLVQHICAEAEAIWGSAGITFEWHRLRRDEPARAWPLDVTIDDGFSDATPDGTLGWLAFTPGGPGRSIHLSRARAESLLRDTPGVTDHTITTHETLLGRALGRALAHELGHYLLRSKAHSRHGLMRPVRTSDEFFSFSRGSFELTPEQRAAFNGRGVEPATRSTRNPGDRSSH